MGAGQRDEGLASKAMTPPHRKMPFPHKKKRHPVLSKQHYTHQRASAFLLARQRRPGRAAITSSACRPLSRCTTENSTRWPSMRMRWPSPRMARKCTKMSSPVSREMKPKPLEVLNHFTVPVSRFSSLIGASGAAPALGRELQDHGDGQDQQGQDDGRLVADGRQRRQQDENLQDHGQGDQRRYQALQLLYPLAGGGEQQGGQAEQGQVDGIGILQVGDGIGAQRRREGQHEGGNARQQVDDFQHVMDSP